MYESVCNLVDLAGSERLSALEGEHKADKANRMQESKHINKSLFFLT